jgi:hypothetical protein
MSHRQSGLTHRCSNWCSASSSYSAPISAVAAFLDQRTPSFRLNFLLDHEHGSEAYCFSDFDWNR